MPRVEKKDLPDFSAINPTDESRQSGLHAAAGRVCIERQSVTGGKSARLFKNSPYQRPIVLASRQGVSGAVVAHSEDDGHVLFCHDLAPQPSAGTTPRPHR